ncbi:putative transcriptional regulator [Terriglobus roseus DSM 18391]|uniref:Putative transcriptional regulator n=1 Tax=Terriglobus roseus (strain DSM 18391 / NRRL B-41598 / KBS 63) TaxID=926566 RepID=I3ZAX3_TERRK|nr:metalloregulator ArsR/SmtB family transcription factor [Terriglobus roseus]AFL86391.1 putative transcriptional regulator [Terriglobus roseus DSM 18391]
MSKKKDKPEKPAATTIAEDAAAMHAISRALADPRRVEVLRMIACSESTSCMDLRTAMTMNPATLSHHMKQLETAGLIETRRDGKLVRATLRKKTWKSYLAHLKSFAA